MHATHAAAVAKDVMNREVITLQEEQSLDEAAAILVEHDISGAPVVDGKGKVLGVVSVTDFMEDRTEGGGEASDEIPAASGWRRFLNPEDLSQLRLRHSGRPALRPARTAPQPGDRRAHLGDRQFLVRLGLELPRVHRSPLRRRLRRRNGADHGTGCIG